MNPVPVSLRPLVLDLTGYTPGEQPDSARVLKLNTNENPCPPSEGVLDAITAGVPRLRLYPQPLADDLRRRLAEYHGIEPDQILVGNGSDEILKLLVQACLDPGGALAMVDPSYSLYPVLAAIFDARVQVYPLENRRHLPEAFFGGPEPLTLLANPNPPVGTLFSREEIQRLCREREGRLVVIDEAYVDFAPRDVVPLLAAHANLAITRTFSKSFSLAGMRIGYLIADAAVVREIQKIKDSYNLSHLAQVAAIAAVDCAEEMRRHAAQIVETRGSTARALVDLGFEVPDSHGNFLFAIHPEAAAIYEALRGRDILVRYFDTPVLRDGLRITIGLPEEMQRLVEALTQIRRSGS